MSADFKRRLGGYTIADLDIRDTRTDLGDHTCELMPDRQPLGVRIVMTFERMEIAAADTNVLHANLDLSLTNSRLRLVDDIPVACALCDLDQCLHAFPPSSSITNRILLYSSLRP